MNTSRLQALRSYWTRSPIEPRTARLALFGALGLALAISGQIAFERDPLKPLDAQLLLGLGVVLWLVSQLGGWSLPSWSLPSLNKRPAANYAVAGPSPLVDYRRKVRLALGIALVLFTAALWPLVFPDGGGLSILRYPDGVASPENRWAPVGTLLWLVGIALYVSAVANGASPVDALVRLKDRARRRWPVWAAAAIILTIAAAFRLHDLHNVPSQVTSDHVEKLLDLHDLVHEGHHRAYFPRNTGREPFQFYWTALFSWIAGMPVSFHTLKLAMVALSLVGVFATWRFARLVTGELGGLVAALVLALAPWDIQITRVALRYELGPVFTAITLWFLCRALLTGSRGAWLALAAALAVGLNGYTAFRAAIIMVPAAIVAWLAVAAWSRYGRRIETGETAERWRAQLGHASWATGLLVLLIAPLLRFGADHPDVFWSRVLRSATAVESEMTEPWRQFANNLWNALRMINWTADAAFLISPPGRPALEPVGAALFLLGAVTALVLLWSGDRRIALTVVGFLAMLGPSTLALAFPGEVPHLARAGGALPAVATIASLPAVVLYHRFHAAAGRSGITILAVAAIVLVVVGARNTTERYFTEYRKSYDGSTHPTREAAGVIRAFETFGGRREDAYLPGWPNGWDYRALGIFLGDPTWNGLIGGRSEDWSDAIEVDARAMADDERRKLFLIGGPDAEARVEALRAIYPAAIVTHHPTQPVESSFYSIMTP